MEQVQGRPCLVACRDCDSLYRRIPLPPGGEARCQRCGAVLYRRSRLDSEQILALTLAALITLAIAQSFPIVSMQVNGISASVTLIGCVSHLWGEGSFATAGLVFATALLFPFLDLAAMLWLVLAARLAPDVRSRAVPSRLVAALRPWGMTEVFVLGVLVSLIKLSHLARVVPGIALWAFIATAVLVTIVSLFDPRLLWDERE